MAEGSWMIHRAGKWTGPYSEAQLREYVSKGIIEGKTLLKDASGQHMYASEAFASDQQNKSLAAALSAEQPTVQQQHQPPDHGVSGTPQYGAMIGMASTYSVIGLLGLIISAIVFLAVLGTGSVVPSAIGLLFGSSLACIATGHFFRLAVDIARNSHRQTMLLDRIAEALKR